MLHVRIHTESCRFWHKSLPPSFTVTIYTLSSLQRTSSGARLLTLEEKYMSLRSCAAILAIAVGLSTVSVAQAAQVANGLTINGLSANGLTANGLTANGLTANGLTINGRNVQGRFREASSGTSRLKAVILQDGSTIDLQ
jgi:hypothetical protein